MPIRVTGPICPRRGCRRPSWKDDLCARCWRLARMFGRDPLLFAYEPLDGYRDELDTVPVDWERWERGGRFGIDSG
jgi:hypothetical protein